MLKIFKGLILFVLLFAMKSVFAQNYNNSPYTRYLIGDLINNGFAYNKALGGSSIALRPHNQINYLNPASYTAQDTNSFLLQIGLDGRHASIQSGLDSDKSFNMNINYFVIGFPVTKWWNVSIGAAPFSRIQYFFREEYAKTDLTETVYVDYNGFGGYNEFYVGNAFSIQDQFSVGFNVSYLFGSLDRKEFSYLPDLLTQSAAIEDKTSFIANDFYIKTGIQYHPILNDRHSFIVGLTYDFGTDIEIKQTGQILRYNTADNASISTRALSVKNDSVVPLKMPSKFAFGISYLLDEKLLVTAEYINQNWSGIDIADNDYSAGLYESYRFGSEYTPVPLSNRIRTKYFKRINYRVGANYTKTYLSANQKNITDYGVSVGLGLPLKNARKIFTGTHFNIGYQYGQRGTTENGLIQENYHNFSIGITLHDFWFLKPKYD